MILALDPKPIVPEVNPQILRMPIRFVKIEPVREIFSTGDSQKLSRRPQERFF